MKTYILLFRGINVGGRNLLPMKALVSLLEQRGFANVRTYIQSGNVVLTGKEAPDESIASEIQSRFGLKPALIVLEKLELEAAVNQNPYRSSEGKSVHFYFSESMPKPDSEKLAALASNSESFSLNGKVFFLHAPDGIGRSKLVASLEKCLGVTVTGRNLNTVNKILDMAENA